MWETNKKIQKELRWYICVTVFFFFFTLIFSLALPAAPALPA